MKKVLCPHCKKETPWKDNSFRPFCSERCRLMDLGEWAEEKYRIPVEDNVKEIDEKEKESGKTPKNT